MIRVFRVKGDGYACSEVLQPCFLQSTALAMSAENSKAHSILQHLTTQAGNAAVQGLAVVYLHGTELLWLQPLPNDRAQAAADGCCSNTNISTINHIARVTKRGNPCSCHKYRGGPTKDAVPAAAAVTPHDAPQLLPVNAVDAAWNDGHTAAACLPPTPALATAVPSRGCGWLPCILVGAATQQGLFKLFISVLTCRERGSRSCGTTTLTVTAGPSVGMHNQGENTAIIHAHLCAFSRCRAWPGRFNSWQLLSAGSNDDSAISGSRQGVRPSCLIRVWWKTLVLYTGKSTQWSLNACCECYESSSEGNLQNAQPTASTASCMKCH